MFFGIDIGSTTVKIVVLDNNENIIHKSYQRHFSKVREKTVELLYDLKDMFSGENIHIAITGSAGMGVSKACKIDFVQEVFATAGAIESYYPQADAVVELGGEDAKIIFFKGGLEERMNGSCAGGTGSFIDQMATLLGISLPELDRLSLKYQKIYSIASRCGVFAKSDIQPLINQGAKREDIAASVFQAVVDQTISGLAQGRKIEGNVVFLGGPLFFLQGLRERFVDTLKLNSEQAVFPQNADCFVALGAALHSKKLPERNFDQVLELIENAVEEKSVTRELEPLFSSEIEYEQFVHRHSLDSVQTADIAKYNGVAYLGIDAGSTTTKLVLITPNGEILYSFYTSNEGNPVAVVLQQLKEIYKLCGDRIKIGASAVTGYGEEIIKNAFSVDIGLVETVAHFRAAQFFNPDTDFILDIGGQDMKCFKIRNNAIDSILLNEACSSGCGSFIETFAKALGYGIDEFSKLGLYAKHPVDLGSRCTVFMNSSVKQAQKDGAGVDDISAGLSMSIVKNAIYKVIRVPQASDLGKNIVVQGGTFLNDAVLRSFEKELGINVIRPSIAGIMGAFGAALYAKGASIEKSTLLPQDKLETFSHTSKSVSCKLCGNRCHLTVSDFGEGRRFISGNRCERPLGRKVKDIPNLYKYKYEKLFSLKGKPGQRGKIGIPMGLNMFENLPFWYAFFTELDFEVVLSPKSDRKLYIKGQHTIPSDTVCYPAKLIHGAIEALVEAGLDTIFYPCLTYNFNEKKGDNHYNCPVVAYYPELLYANVKSLKNVHYLMPYFGIHRRKDFIKHAAQYFGQELSIAFKEVERAAQKAYEAYDSWISDIREQGAKMLEYAKQHNKRVIVLAGRPYHLDPEINHGIDRLISSFDIVVLSEDAVSHLVEKQDVKVLNQWTYHSRLYDAAKFVTENKNMELVQLVSFGCGIDAITGDETRDILEKGGKLYTQIKIDEINNLGAAKIRIRSLLATMDVREDMANG